MSKLKSMTTVAFLITLLLMGCTNELTQEEVSIYVEDYNDLVKVTTNKVLDRTEDVIRYSEKKREDNEIGILIGRLQDMLKDVEKEIPDENKELFEDMKSVHENLFQLEVQNTSSDFRKEQMIELELQIVSYGDTYLTKDTETSKIVKDIISSSGKFSEEIIEDFQKDNNLSLTAKDIQYDLVNNLDKNFLIVGKAELDDYFNYGFKNEEDYFSVRVTPDGENYSASWSLYFHRESFGELYQVLKDGDVNLMAVAKIPKWSYDDNQGNMAQVTRVNWR